MQNEYFDFVLVQRSSRTSEALTICCECDVIEPNRHIWLQQHVGNMNTTKIYTFHALTTYAQPVLPDILATRNID